LGDRSSKFFEDGKIAHIAGGMNSFTKLIETLVLTHQTCQDWVSCLARLESLLKQDLFFKAVSTHLRSRNLISQPFVLMDKISPTKNDVRSVDVVNNDPSTEVTGWCVPKNIKPDISSVLKLNSNIWNECSGQELPEFLQTHCGTVDLMKDQTKGVAGSKGKFLTTCSGTLARAAYVRLIFGKDELPKRPAVDIAVALDASGLGDPKDGALWAYKHSQGPLRLDKSKGRCVAKARVGKGTEELVKKEKACLTVTQKNHCLGPVCHWIDPQAQQTSENNRKDAIANEKKALACPKISKEHCSKNPLCKLEKDKCIARKISSNGMEVDVSDEEMANSSFGKSSNTAKRGKYRKF